MAGFFPDNRLDISNSLNRHDLVRMLGLAKYRKNVGNSLVKEHDWEAALLCYLNGLYLLNYAKLAAVKSKAVKTEAASSTGTAASDHFCFEKLHEDWPDLSLGELPKFLQGLDEKAKDKYRTTPPWVAASRGDIEVARNLWLQPCANPELGAALYSNVAFAALKCGGSRTVDHVCLAAVAAVCALREALNWREFGLYQGCQLFSAETHMVYMKARLRALEAFEKLGNWGQVCANGCALKEMLKFSTGSAPPEWHQQVEAKLRDVRDWRLWHNATDGAVVHVDARDTRQKWVLTGHAPPMHRDWHRLGALRAEHKLAARLEELKARMVPGGKALEAFTAIDKEVDPGGSALEACLAVGEEVNVMVAHSMVSKNDGERYLHLQMLLIGEGEDGCLDVRPAGRYVMAMDAETIGGSVVHAAGSAIIWGSCRGSQAASETAGKACMVYFHLSLRELSTLFPEDDTDVWPKPRRNHTAIMYKNDMYIFGGDRWQMTSGSPADCEGTYHNDVWKFNIDKQRWCCLIPDAQGPTEGERPVARGAHGAFEHGGYMYIFGGICDDEVHSTMDPATLHLRRVLGDLWRFHLAEHTWEPVFTCGNLPGPRCRFGLAQPDPDKVVVFGGMAQDDTGAMFQLSDMFELTISQRWWRQVLPSTPYSGGDGTLPAWPAGVSDPMMAALPSGRLLVARTKHKGSPLGLSTSCRATLAATVDVGSVGEEEEASKHGDEAQGNATPYPQLPAGYDQSCFYVELQKRDLSALDAQRGACISSDTAATPMKALLTVQTVLSVASAHITMTVKRRNLTGKTREAYAIPVNECMQQVSPGDLGRRAPFISFPKPAFALPRQLLPGETWYGASVSAPTPVGWELLDTPALVHQLIRYFNTVKAAQDYFRVVKEDSLAEPGTWAYPGYVETGHGALNQDQSAVPHLAMHIAEQDKRLQKGCTELVIVQRKFAEPGADCGPSGLVTDPHRGITYTTVLLVAARCFIRLHFSLRGLPEDLRALSLTLASTALTMAQMCCPMVRCEACGAEEPLPHEDYPRAERIKVCGGCGCVRYCSVECQRRHRGIHRDYCREMGSLPRDKHSSVGGATSAKVKSDNIPELGGSGHKSEARENASD